MTSQIGLEGRTRMLRLVFIYNIALYGISLILALSPILSNAQSQPQALNISGGIFNSNGTPVTSNNVAFRAELLDKAASCVLYSEEHLAQDLTNTKGAFSLQFGAGTSASNNLQGGTAFTFGLFLNNGPTGTFATCAPGVNLAAGDERLLRLSYNLGAGWVLMTPNIPIVSAATAMVADTLRGKIPTDFVQTNGASAQLTQSNVETIFSNVNYPKLNALLDGTSSQYLPTTPTVPVNVNNQRIVNIADPTGAQDAATKNYADSNLGGKTVDSAGVGLGSGGGKTLIWDQILNKWVAQTPASYVSGVVAGAGLRGGTITSFGTLSADVGTSANQIVQLTNLAYLPAVDGHLLTNIQFPVVSVAGRTGVVTLNAADISGLGTASTKDFGTASGNLVELAGNSLLPALDGSLLTNLNATYLRSRLVAATAPTAGQILAWNASASQWEPATAPVAGITALIGDVTATGPGSVTATLVNDRVTSAKINSTGNVANRLLITDATTGATVTYANCLDGEIMKFSITTGWGCTPDAGAAGAVTLVSAGTGLLGGTISSTGTLSVDVGITAGKILQLNGSAQIPAVDGSLVGNVNAVRLRSRDVSGAAPAANQVLRWNNGTSVWEPSNENTSQIVAGAGLLGGTVSSGGTLSVDTGTTGNKIVQLVGGQYPAVDGSQISNLNVTTLQGRSVSATGPAGGQILGWNGSTSQWEPVSAGGTGTVLSVTSGAGLIGGLITSSGTLSVDVGTAANKILQLNGSAQIPAVDGSLVSNINAVKLQSRAVSSAAPSAGQFIGWNTSSAVWEPMSASAGSMTGVVSGTGLIAGTVTGYGTLNVDVGVTANKILQLNSSAQIPAVDAFLLTNLNVTTIQGRTVSAAGPAGGQILGWNGSTSQWEPVSAGGTGTVLSVTSGAGLIGGLITSSGTLSVDVGTAANKILQLNGSAQIPAVDGSLVSNINAVKLQSRNVSSAAPSGGQFIGWNTSAAAWEPMSGSAGSMTGVVSGMGLIAGTVTGYGTINIDVGVTANKILQLNSSAQIPAVDAFLLTNLNVTTIQGRTVSAAGPAGGQILGWNGSTSQWEPVSAVGTGTVLSVSSGTGLIGGMITSSGTLSVDVGTAANKILQLNGSAQIPAVDGSLVSNINAVKLQSRNVSSTAPAGGQILGWNSSSSQWEPVSAVGTGTVLSVASGAGLIGGPITSSGTLSVDVGTAANKILQLNGSAQIPAVDGSLVSNVNAVKLQSRNVSSAAPSGGQFIGWNTSAAAWEPMSAASGSMTGVVSGTGLSAGTVTGYGTLNVDVGVSANKILQLNGTAQIPAVDGSLVSNVNAVKLQARNVSNAAPAGGQILGWNGSSSQWEPVSAVGTGTVLSVASGAGLIGGPITSSGTLSVDVGTAANKILQLNGSAQIPAVDGSLVSNVNAVKLQSRNVSSAAPSDGQFIGWNTSAAAWEPMSGSAGSMTGVVSGTGLIAGTVTGYGTLSLDVGVTANKILQLNGSAQIPAVDGSLVSNVNAVKLQSRNVSNAAPAGGQILGWNGSTSQWEPVSAGGTGTVMSVTSGTGLIGGPITSSGTLSVDVGTAANKILQLNGSAQIPAVDGSLVSNVNAVKLQSRNVSSVAPAGGQFIGWNTSAAAWEPMSAASGSMTGVVSGTGLSAGTVTGYGTLNVDVGVSANKILQLNGTAQIPAVDGSLVSNVNAVKLQARNVSNAAPAGGQILGWNSSSSQWEPVSAGGTGTVLSVTSGTGLIGGLITSSGTLSVDVGTAANKILQLNGSAQIPAVDGSLVSNVNAVKLQSRNVSSAAPAAGQFIGWNTSAAAWEPMSASTGSVTGVVAGIGVVAGTISSYGTINIDVGITANKVLQLNGLAQIPAVDGSLVSNINAVKLQSRNVSSTAPAGGQILGWNNSTSQWEPVSAGGTGTVLSVASGAGLIGGLITSSGTLSVDVGTSANKILQLNGSAQIPAVDGSLVSNINAVKLQSRNVSSAAPAGGQILGWNTSAAAWEPMTASTGSMTGVVSGTGLIAGTVTGYGTINIDVGTTGNKIVQLVGGKYPAVDGFQISNLNVTKIQGRTVSATGPAGGQILGWNSSASQWEPVSAGGTGTVLSVASGAGLVGGLITSSGTLSVDVGTSANKILQLNGSAQIPAVDGSLVSNVNAVKLQSRNVSSAAPSGGQFIGWNTSAAAWEPMTASTGSMTGVVSGTGLIAGTVTGYGTLNVDVGTTANKILQLNGSAQIPAVDGSLVSNVNAVKLQGRKLASVAPIANQVLTWNGSQWEARDIQASSSSFVNGGNSFAGNATLGTNDNYSLGFETNNATQMTIDALGNVGIGTTTITSKLTVLGSVDASVQFLGQASDTAAAPSYSWTGDPDTGIWRPAANTVSITTNATEALRVTAAGYVGVGVTNPAALVDIGGAQSSNSWTTKGRNLSITANTITDTSSTATVGTRVGSSFAQPTFASSNPITVTNAATLYIANAPVQGANTTITNAQALHVANGDVYFGGDVGIGTLVPGAKLDIYGTSTLNSAIIVPRATTTNRPAVPVAGMIRYNTTTAKFEAFEGAAWVNMTASGSSGFVNGGNAFGANSSIGNSDNYRLDFLTNATARLSIDNVGNVGIGTTSPTSALDVNGAINIRGADVTVLKFSGETSSSGIPSSDGSIARYESDAFGSALDGLVFEKTDFNANQPDGGILFANRGMNGIRVPSLAIRGSGAIGIGTATPQAMLDVRGTGTFQSAMIVPRDTTANKPGGVNGMIRYNTNTNKLEAFENGAWGNVTAAGSSGYVNGGNSYGANATLGTNDGYSLGLETNNATRMTIDALGNVGIGTTTPKFPLEIYGVPQLTGDIADSGVRTGILALNANSGTAGSGGAVVFGNSQSLTAGSLGFASIKGYLTGNANNTIGALTFATRGNATDTSLTERMRIDSAGRVGIGTNAPAWDLHISRIGSNPELMLESVATSTAALGSTPYIYLRSYSGSSGSPSAVPSFRFSRARGTKGSEAFLQNGDFQGQFMGYVWNGSGYTDTARMALIATENHSSTAIGTALAFRTVPNGTLTDIERMRIDNDGTVGIGTASPSAGTILDIYGATTLNSSMIVPRGTTAARPTTGIAGMIRYNSTLGKFEAFEGSSWVNMTASGSSGYVNGGNANGANSTIGLTDNYKLSFLTNNATQMTIDALGNVGIGTTTITSKLTVLGSVDASVQFLGQATDTAAAPSFSWTGDTDTGVWRPAANTVSITTNGTEAMRVNSSGRVGIGTTTIVGALDVVDTSTAISGNVYGQYIKEITAPTAASTASVYGQYVLADSTGAGANNLTTIRGIYSLARHNATGNLTNLRGMEGLAQNNNTGIITNVHGAYAAATNASTGTMTNATGSYALVNNSSTGTITNAYAFTVDINNAGGGTLTNGYGVYINSIGASTNSYGIYQLGTTDKNYLAGATGIGTATPQAMLDVRGTGTFQSAMIVPRDTTALRPGGVNGMIRYNTNTNKLEAFEDGTWGNMTAAGASGYVNGGNSYGGNATLGTNDNYSLGLETNSATRMTIDSLGNVGIGTTTITSKLTVLGSVDASVQFLGQATDTAAAPSFSWTGDADTGIWRPTTNTVSITTNGIEALRVNGSGYLGVGTTSPNALVDIGGTLTATSWTTKGRNLSVSANTLIDNSGSGAVATRVSNSFATPTFASLTNAETITNGANVYIAGAPSAGANTSITNPWALYVAAGDSYFGGNIGVGTANPQAKLDIYATSTLDSAIIVPRATTTNRPAVPVAGMIRYNTTTTKFEAYEGAAWVNMTASGSSGFINGGNTFGATSNIGNQDGYDLRIMTSNATRMTVTALGNVGIGTTSPSSPLHIVGTNPGGLIESLMVGNTSGTTGSSARIYMSGNNSKSRAAYIEGINSENGGGNKHDLAFGTTPGGGTPVERMRIMSTGQIGIGTAAPSANLHVYGGTPEFLMQTNNNSAPKIILQARESSGSANIPDLIFRNEAGVDAGAVHYDASINTMKFDTNTFSRMYIDGLGNIGIGTSTATSRLTVLGSVDASVQFLGQASDTAAAPSFSWTGDADTGVWRPAANTVSITTNASEALRVTSAGYVGVGLTAPAALVDIGGAQSSSSWTTKGRNLSVTANTLTDTSSTATVGTRVGSSFAQPTFASSNAITVTNAATLYIANAPAAGTNTTITNAQALHVAAGDVYFGGDVGIGTLVPGAKLDIYGTSTLNSAIIVPRATTANRPAAPVAGMIRYNTTTAKFEAYEGAAWVNMTASGASGFVNGGNAFGSNATLGTTDYKKLSLITNNSSAVTIDGAGSVGVGTASPARAFHVYGNPGTAGMIMLQRANNTTDRLDITYEPSGALSGSNSRWVTGVMENSNAYRIGSYDGTLLTQSFVVDSTGNVGIGTVTPGFRLDVVGSIRTDQAVLNSSGVPTLSACGTTPVVTAGSSNSAGQFQLGTATPTTCTVTFADAYPTKAFCTVTPANAAATGTFYISAQSKTSFTITLTVGVNSAKYNYTCGGN